MNWWQWTLALVGGTIALLALMLGTYLAFWACIASGKWCRCGHGASAHRGPATECYGRNERPANDLGIKGSTWCQCKKFRHTERGVWDRLTIGFEENPAEQYRGQR